MCNEFENFISDVLIENVFLGHFPENKKNKEIIKESEFDKISVREKLELLEFVLKDKRPSCVKEYLIEIRNEAERREIVVCTMSSETLKMNWKREHEHICNLLNI